MEAMISTMDFRSTVDIKEVEEWAKAALDGLRKEPGFKGLLVLREGQASTGSTAYAVTLWETKERLLAARGTSESRRQQNDLVALLAAPLKQRSCQVLVDVRH